MGSVGQDEAPQLMYPAPLEAERGAAPATSTANASYDIETPILIVGGGPVGMLQSLMLARMHNIPSVLIERETTTTAYPKMEYTNGRSMEIYRMMGLSEEFRALGNSYVPEDAKHDELIVTGMTQGAKLIGVWERPSVAEMRKISRETNDGSKYLEPHLRCHQIPVEKWLKGVVKRESGMIESHWGWQFLGLVEDEGGVVSEVKTKEGNTLRIKSQYVIGCDGGGSWVRKSVGLESKRTYLDLTVAFVHFRSKYLRGLTPFQPFWHSNIISGGILVSQNEDDLWTCHLMLPPGVDGKEMTSEEIIAASVGGCNGPTSIEFDEIYTRGIWKVDVAIANKFRSDQGRVFLAGDAAHQLSPVGGHGLNSGLADAFDLAWKLSASINGWAGDGLLESYDTERRQIAFKNLDTVHEALVGVVMPLIVRPAENYGAQTLASDTAEGEKARKEVGDLCPTGHWFHNQDGNMLGYQYKDSPFVITEQETTERPISDKSTYLPTTWPGSRTPHVWRKDTKKSTLDSLRANTFSLVDFSLDVRSSDAFEAAAKELKVPLQSLKWHAEDHVREVFERDLVLIRPDMHVAWRTTEGADNPVSVEEARNILARVVAR